MFPTLHSDLLEGKTNTLEAFIVKRRQYEIPEPSCELEKLIIQKLCLSAAAVIKLQCEREYVSDGDLKLMKGQQISQNSLKRKNRAANQQLYTRERYQYF